MAAVLVAGCNVSDASNLTSQPGCGAKLFDPERVSTITWHPAKDEGEGVISVLTDNNGERPYRQIELVDCRAGVMFWAEDSAVTRQEAGAQPASATGFLQLVERLRSQGQLSDLDHSAAAFERAGDTVSPRHEKDGRRIHFDLADPGAPTEGYGCACQLFYPGSATSWVPSEVSRNLHPKTLPEARAMVAAWRAQQRAALSTRTGD